jgi:hypothetical protein
MVGEDPRDRGPDRSMMRAYIFWHRPYADTDRRAYEAALRAFHRDLAADPPPGFDSSATYRITAVPWLDQRPGYEDWYLVESSAALDPLNKAAVKPARWDVHAAISSLTETGHGGLYAVLHGRHRAAAGTRVAWLKRPRGIRYESPLGAILDRATGVVSCWRKQMVLGPAPEFAVVGDPTLDLQVPDNWESLVVER